MSILDGLLGQVAGNVDITNLAEKIGLPADKLQEIVGHIGGEGALAQFSSLLHSEGSLTDKLSGFASGLFGQ